MPYSGPYSHYSLVRFVRNLTIHGPEHLRTGLYDSIEDIHDHVLSCFPWLPLELWICDMTLGGRFTRLSRDRSST